LKRFLLVFLLSTPIMLPIVAAAPSSQTAGDGRQGLLPPAASGDAVAGKFKAEDARCLECHDSNAQQPGQGLSNGPDGKFARLAGQYPEYIAKQVRDFRSGGRRHDFMSMIANSVDDADLADIAAYFASQQPMRGDDGGDNQLGKNLFISGDISISCHGSGGKGLSADHVSYPAIGGQGRLYLEKQLRDWRSGERRNDATGVMNSTARALTDAEIQALASYVSGL